MRHKIEVVVYKNLFEGDVFASKIFNFLSQINDTGYQSQNQQHESEGREVFFDDVAVEYF